MDPQFIALFQSAGPVGAVALVFYIIWQKSEVRYAELAKGFRDIVEKNTEVNTRLCMLIETQTLSTNGNKRHNTGD
jgi:hypothetical protein